MWLFTVCEMAKGKPVLSHKVGINVIWFCVCVVFCSLSSEAPFCRFFAAPVISMPPQDVQNFTGNDVIFGCEVSAYPMPHLEWKKKGNKMFLPGDDAHISVQVKLEFFHVLQFGMRSRVINQWIPPTEHNTVVRNRFPIGALWLRKELWFQSVQGSLLRQSQQK